MSTGFDVCRLRLKMSYGNERDRQRAHRDYVAFRKRVPKIDVTFLGDEGRRKRVCETPAAMVPFVEGILQMADKAKAEGRDIHCALDVETEYVGPGDADVPDPFFWHRRHLREKGATDEELAAREAWQKQKSAEWSKKSPKAKRNQREGYKKERKEKGLLQSDVMCFQIGCREDREDRFLFVANPVKMASGGVVALPQLRRLIEHPAIVWVNVGVTNDLQLISDSFFDAELRGIRCAELQLVVEKAYGGPLVKRSDVSGNGLLGLFQRVFSKERYTYRKDPLLTRSKWKGEWTAEQLEYAVMDIRAVTMILRKIIPLMEGSIGAMASLFPVVAPISQANKASTSGICAAPTMEELAAPWEFEASSDSFSDGSSSDEGPTTSSVKPYFDEEKVAAMERHFAEQRAERAKKMEAFLASPAIMPAADEDWNLEAEPDARGDAADRGDAARGGGFVSR